MSYKLKTFIIYAKARTGGRFQALDLDSCIFVDRLIFATLLSREEAQRVLNHLAIENPEFEFEARSQGEGKEILKPSLEALIEGSKKSSDIIA